MNPPEFEDILSRLCQSLNKDVRGTNFAKSSDFELRVREALADLLYGTRYRIDFSPHPHVFPDIVLGKFGVEVKFTLNNTWRSVANSIFEGTRKADVKHIYVVFGKMGGQPEVRFGRYEECVMHVRTSHVPRFELEIGAEESLFDKIGISYEDFAKLPVEDRMKHVRSYARGRLKPGERLWWLEDSDEPSHSLPLQVRLYMRLDQPEKRQLRAEAALLCPQVVSGSRQRGKYNDAVIYLLTYRGVLCPQARDLFSAGSVALRKDSRRGGNYLLRALSDIQEEMVQAAECLEDSLFVEYWGRSVPKRQRIQEWLKMADSHAHGWVPSERLFRGNR